MAAARTARDAFRDRRPAALRALRDGVMGSYAATAASDDPTARPG